MPSKRTIRAFCPRCRHQQPFKRAQFFWKFHLGMTVVTLGIWSIILISSLVKRLIWPWNCEHCGWHEPDFRSPEERRDGKKKKPSSGSWSRKANGEIVQRGGEETPPADLPPPA